MDTQVSAGATTPAEVVQIAYLFSVLALSVSKIGMALGGVIIISAAAALVGFLTT